MHAIHAARALLPVWVVWMPALLRVGVALVLIGAVTLTSGGLAAGAVSRIDPSLHWTERARLGLAWRTAVASQPLVLGLLAAMAVFVVGPLALPPSSVVAIGVVIATVAIATPVRVLVERRARQLPGPFWKQVWQTLLFGFVRVPHLWALIVLGFLAPSRLDSLAWGVLALALALMASAATGLYLAPSRALGFVRPAGERVQRLVAEAAQRTGITPKEVLELRVSVANALAYPTTGAIAFTTAAIEALDDAQLVAITAHELGHLAEPLRLRALRAATPLALAPLVLFRPLLASGDLFGLLAMLAVVALWLWGFRFAVRHTEKHADAVAHRAEGDAGVYASALETLYRVNMVPAVLRVRRTAHPHLYDRLVAAGITPSYPRPQPPPLLAFYARLPPALAVVALCVATAFLSPGAHLLPIRGPTSALVSVALNGGDRASLEALAEDAVDDGRPHEARTFERAAAQMPF